MPAKNKSKKPAATPLTFDLPLPLMEKVETCRRTLGLGTTSQVVRFAIEKFDFEGCSIGTVPHQQISVRIPAAQRTALKRLARKKDTSIGELLRIALEALPARGNVPAARKKRS